MISMNRLDTLKSILAQNPSDTFARYGLAMEYVKGGELTAAVDEFRAVIGANPGYTYAYFHCGQTLEKLGRTDDAREAYEQGIDAARYVNDQKALNELQGALDLLPL
jgi:Tfp pilus assembly protein PilF